MTSTTTFAVSGMTCQHCAKTITEELEGLPGVDEVTVDLESGHVTLSSATTVVDAQVSAAVERAGYRFLHTVRA